MAHFLKLLQQYRKRMWADRIKFLTGEEKGRIFRRVREVVERYGYSQREVAEYLGVHYSSVR